MTLYYDATCFGQYICRSIALYTVKLNNICKTPKHVAPKWNERKWELMSYAQRASVYPLGGKRITPRGLNNLTLFGCFIIHDSCRVSRPPRGNWEAFHYPHWETLPPLEGSGLPTGNQFPPGGNWLPLGDNELPPRHNLLQKVTPWGANDYLVLTNYPSGCSLVPFEGNLLSPGYLLISVWTSHSVQSGTYICLPEAQTADGSMLAMTKHLTSTHIHICIYIQRHI